MFKTSVHKSNDGEVVCIDKGATVVCKVADMRTTHVERKVFLSPPAPGVAPIQVEAAIFEFWQYSGHVFISLYDLRDAVLPGSDMMGWRWWQKKVPSMQNTASKYQLGANSYLPGMPYGERGRRDTPERCLAFPSVSVSLLLVTCLRSAFTTSQTKGRVREDDVRQALGVVFEGMMKHLPLDCRP